MCDHKDNDNIYPNYTNGVPLYVIYCYDIFQ